MTGVPDPAIRCVGALIYDTAGRLLLVRRAHEPGRGRWSIPGGRVEPDETDAAALVREVGEETGLHITVGRPSPTVRRPAPRGTFLIADYHCAFVGGTARAGTDATELAWVDAAQFASLNQAGHLVDELANTLRDWYALPQS